MPPVLVITQARIESSRFPGKVLTPLLGQPLLLWHLSRASQMTTPHTLIVASPDTPENYAIADLCAKHGYRCMLVPGDPNDLLARFTYVLERTEETPVLRLCGDCPLIDPVVIDGLLAHHLYHAIHSITRRGILSTTGELVPCSSSIRYPLLPDYTGLGLSWGDGFDCELFSRDALETAHKKATLPSEREHCWPYVKALPKLFRHSPDYQCPFDLSWLRTSIDDPQDLPYITDILQDCLAHYGHTFGWREIWHIVSQTPSTIAYMHARAHNPAYCHQVAQENGWPGEPHWADLRYGVTP